MAIKFSQKLQSYNATSPILEASYLDIKNSTNKENTTIADTDLFIMQDGSQTGTANTGKIQALDIKTYIGTSQITGLTLSSDDDTIACTGTGGDLDFMITGGTNCSTVSDINEVEVNVPNASASTLGAAKFSTANFSVSSGNVTIKAGGIPSAALQDACVGSDEIADGAIDTVHIADNQITLSKIATLAVGDITYGAAGSGDPTTLTAGSTADVLTVSGGVPTWAAPAPTTWGITDGTTSNTAFSTGETFQYTGGDSITATISGEGTTTTILTIDLNESISVDTEITGTAANKALWTDCTGTISVGTATSTFACAGSITMEGDTTSINSTDTTIEDKSVVFATNSATPADDWGGPATSGAGVDSSLLFGGADSVSVDETCTRQMVKLVADHDYAQGWNSTTARAALRITHASTHIFATEKGTAAAGELAVINSAGMIFDSGEGTSLYAAGVTSTQAPKDGTVVWNGTDLYIYDA